MLFAGSGYPGVDISNRRALGGPIDSRSVGRLKLAWSDPLTQSSTYGSYASTPVIVDGVMYSQDLDSNVEAIELATGKVLWSASYELPDQGPNGLCVADGRVYGATSKSAFALDQRTGRQLWSMTLTHTETEGIDMAPGYHEGAVYVSTVPVTATSQYRGRDVGVLWALDASTGRPLWRFRTIASSAGGGGGAGGGGAWYAPAFDASGSMYVGIGNPTPFPGTQRRPWGSGRPGPNLFSDSVVKLDARTGAVRWYFQLTPHDLYDWDLQDPPILTRGASGEQLVLVAGKGGIVVALDAATGRPAWKRPVGTHDGHDLDGLYAMRGEYSRLKTPATIFPGLLGGVIAPMATNGADVFVPVVNHSATVVGPSQLTESGGSGGELVAISVSTGVIAWRRSLAGPPFGAVTVVNDLVFATTFEGVVLAFDASTGSQVWSEALPAGTNAGVIVSGGTLIAPAGVANRPGISPEIVAYRLRG